MRTKRITRCYATLSPKVKRIPDKVATFYEKHPLLRLLVSVPLFSGFHEMLIAHASKVRTPSDIDDLEKALKIGRSLDKSLLELIRDHTHASPRLIAEEYKAMIRNGLENHGLTEDALARFLRNSNSIEKVVSPGIAAGLDVQVSPGCKSVTFKCDDAYISVDPAELLWDCTCNPTAIGYKKAPECPIHRWGTSADIIDSKFAHHTVRISYKKTSVLWRRGSGEFWPPSVDAIHMLDTMAENDILQKSIPRVLDLGCGTGFLGIAVAQANPTVTSVTFTDWLFTPLYWSAINWANAIQTTRAQGEFRLALNIPEDWISESINAFDAVFCNPPYLPLLPEFKKLALQNTVAGTELLETVIEQGPNLSPLTIVSFSEIARPEAERARAKGKRKLIRLGKITEVPFRVPDALLNTDYLSWLVTKRGLMEKKGRYWHHVGTYVVE